MPSAETVPESFNFPSTYDVAVTGNGVPFAERISETLLEAGCRMASADNDGADVLISIHPRIDAAVCAEIRDRIKPDEDRVLVLVVEQAGSGDVRRALQAGAHVVVPETSIESALIPSIGAAVAGQVVIPARARSAGEPKTLTTREKQILGLVVMGMSNAEIAHKLFLAESTIKSHLSSAFSKLGVASRSEAASIILDPQSGAGLGILTIPTD